MAYTTKSTPDIKYRIVSEYLEGRFGLDEAARKAGVDGSTFRNWISTYKSEGYESLTVKSARRIYPIELKLDAVHDYLTGNYSLFEVCRKYKIRSKDNLRSWIKIYNSHGKFQTYAGGTKMTTTRKTTYEERIEIVKFCLSNGRNYSLAAQKYSVSYQRVIHWVKQFIEYGEEGLEDRRGKQKAIQTPRNETEKLQKEIEKLKRDLYMAQMENDLLKKFQELERRDASHK